MDKYKKLKITGILLLYPTIFSVIIGPVTVSSYYTFSMALGTVFVISLFTSLPIGIGLIVYVWKKKRKEQKTKDLEEPQFTEIKQLLKEYKSMTKIKEKIQGWKKEGYKVDELEKMNLLNNLWD